MSTLLAVGHDSRNALGMRSIAWITLAALLGCGDDKCKPPTIETAPGVCHVPGGAAGSVDESDISEPVAGRSWPVETSEAGKGGTSGSSGGGGHAQTGEVDSGVADAGRGGADGGSVSIPGAGVGGSVRYIAGSGGFGGGAGNLGTGPVGGTVAGSGGAAGMTPVTPPPAGMPAPGPHCGDNHVDPSEVCDGNCPMCTQTTACLADAHTGSASTCDLKCSWSPITACKSGDGCCAPGCTHANDNDCAAKCGDGTLDPGEECEVGSSKPCPSSCDDGDPCADDAMVGSAAQCSLKCTHSPIAHPPVEVCDGVDNDCNGKVDDGVGSYWFVDCDSDGYAPQSTGVQSCQRPAEKNGCGWTPVKPLNGTADCDDTTVFRAPDSTRVFGLPINVDQPEAGLPPARDWIYDSNCDGVQEATTQQAWIGTVTNKRLDIILTCDVLPDCSKTNGPGCITGFSFLGDLICGQPYGVMTACGGTVQVFFLCK